MGAWFVYIVRCRDGSLYTGISRDVEARVRKHNQGRGARYTRGRAPVRLVHREPTPNQPAALRREAAIKSLSRREKLALIVDLAYPEDGLSPPGWARNRRGDRAASALERKGKLDCPRCARRAQPIRIGAYS